MRLSSLLALGALVGVGLVTLTPAVIAPGFIDCVHYTLIGVSPVAYLAIDNLPGEKYIWSWWIYAETNALPGLQRGGTTLLGDTDICQLYANHDQGIF